MARREVIQGTNKQIHVREYPDDVARRTAREEKRDVATRPSATAQAKLDYVIDLLEAIAARTERD